MKEESLKYGSNMFPFHCLHWKQDNYINALPCVLAVARSNFAAKWAKHKNNECILIIKPSKKVTDQF